MSATKKGYALKTFKDAGTGEEFEGGKEHDFAPGAHLNYEAAGLIGEKPTTAAKPPEKSGTAA